jgi:glycosyltransferase involved in cell wall biosynthesis
MHGAFLQLCQEFAQAAKAWPDLRPDLLVSHCGLGPSLFLAEQLSCPAVGYCEYYLARQRRDLTYRVDLPPVEPAPFYPRCINAATLLGLTGCRSGYTPTAWQRDSFPARFRSKIAVHFDGLDTELYQPRPHPPAGVVVPGLRLPGGTRLVTYAARGLESMRGFDLFLRVAQRIARERSDVVFAIAGGEETYYGWDRLHTGGPTFREWAVAGAAYDVSRFVFLGQIVPDELARVLARSDLHIFLTVPFVLSWSLFDALASGCVVLAADVPPVREVIEPGVNGLVENLFDVDRLTETALKVLDDPAAFRPLGVEARRRVEERYSLDVAVPELRAYFERQVAVTR